MEINSSKNIINNILKFNFQRIYWIIVAIVFIWFVFIKPEYEIIRLKFYGQETKGWIYEKSNRGSRRSIRCFYYFNVDYKIFEGFSNNAKLNKGDSIEIIYYIKDPNINRPKQFVVDN